MQDLLDRFLEEYIARKQLKLYEAQEEAILELYEGKHVFLKTPTGSGKSLVALALHYRAFYQKQRSVYTSPIKALVSEKFFDLCKVFGAQHVGMLTGDVAVNPQAEIICCTAEILAQIALSPQQRDGLHAVIMDEFHYYSDAERGVVWQLPLLLMTNSQFLLMSATMGDSAIIEAQLEDFTKRPVAIVSSQLRPVPLEFIYNQTPLCELLQDLLAQGKTPIYIVHFSQTACVQEAQNAMSIDFCRKEEKQKIKEAIGDFRFDSPFGKDMKRYVSHGVGLHHAGLLPKYRLLVEKLAQQGLLKVIMGTDTLGVGINVPIRTVLFSQLYKYNGEKLTILPVRDFLQISGRAGRKGFDEQGTVIAQAPEHVIENLKMENKFSADKQKKRKIVKKKPPEKNFLAWDLKTFETLQHLPPEPLHSQFKVSYGMLLTLINQSTTYNGYRDLIAMIHRCHDKPLQKKQHKRHSRLLFQALLKAQIIHINYHQNKVQLTSDTELQDNFSLYHALSLYLLEALNTLDPQSTSYTLDIVSLVEAILDPPYVVLNKQVDKLKTEKMHELKSQGVEYNERLEELEKIEYPKPLAELIYETFNTYAACHPWLKEDNIYPKSIARDMVENLMSFSEYIKDYQLMRCEGVLLRYLTQVYKTLLQVIPIRYENEALADIKAYLKMMISRVDSSLIEEWQDLKLGNVSLALEAQQTLALQALQKNKIAKPSISDIKHRLKIEIRQFLAALSRRHYEEAAEMIRQEDPPLWSADALEKALQSYVEAFGSTHYLLTMIRSSDLQITSLGEGYYEICQILADPQESCEWAAYGRVHEDDYAVEDRPLLRLVSIGGI